MVKYMSPLPGRGRMKKLIQAKQWDAIRKILDPRSVNSSVLREKFEGGLTCLSLAVCHDAPTDVIDAIIKVDSSLLMNRDVFGLNVLHLGCLNGASLYTIQHIAEHSLFLLRQLDVDKRTPLHHAVEYSIQCVLEDQDEFFYYIEVLEEIVSVAPDLVLIQDVAGITPIDMVQDVKVKTEVESMEYDRLDIVYDVLNSAAVATYKDMQREWIQHRLKQEDVVKTQFKRKTDMPPLGKLKILDQVEPGRTLTCSSLSSAPVHDR